MTSERFNELLNANKEIYLINEIEDAVYDFTHFPIITVKIKGGKPFTRPYNKDYDEDVDTLIYGKKITKEEFHKFLTITQIIVQITVGS